MRGPRWLHSSNRVAALKQCVVHRKLHLHHYQSNYIDLLVSSYFLANTVAFSTGVEGLCASVISRPTDIRYVLASDAASWLRLKASEVTPSFLATFKTTPQAIITVKAVPIVGWNMQSNVIQTPNPVANRIITKIVNSYSTQTNSSLPLPNGYEMSSGVKAGIGVSAGICIFIVILCTTWTVRLKRKNKKLSTKINDESQRMQSSDVHSNGIFNPARPCELCASQMTELGHDDLREIGGSPINELGHRSIHELDHTSFLVQSSATASPREATEG